MNVAASWKIELMLSTDATFHDAMFWLKAMERPQQVANKAVMSTTRATFQAATGWLNAYACTIIFDIVVTDATFQLPMSSLNVGWLANTEAMLVTVAVFQYPMGPYVVAAVVGLVTHTVTAAPTLASVMRHAAEAHVG